MDPYIIYAGACSALVKHSFGHVHIVTRMSTLKSYLISDGHAMGSSAATSKHKASCVHIVLWSQAMIQGTPAALAIKWHGDGGSTRARSGPADAVNPAAAVALAALERSEVAGAVSKGRLKGDAGDGAGHAGQEAGSCGAVSESTVLQVLTRGTESARG